MLENAWMLELQHLACQAENELIQGTAEPAEVRQASLKGALCCKEGVRQRRQLASQLCKDRGSRQMATYKPLLPPEGFTCVSTELWDGCRGTPADSSRKLSRQAHSCSCTDVSFASSLAVGLDCCCILHYARMRGTRRQALQSVYWWYLQAANECETKSAYL